MGVKTRILVVDDDQATRELLVLVLVDAGYEVVTAEHGRAALEVVRATPPSVILLDLRMPVLDGWAFARAYHQARHPRVPIIAVTADREAEGWEAPIGVAAVLPKPFDLDVLLRVVDEQARAVVSWGLPAPCMRRPVLEGPVERSGAFLGATVPLAEVLAELAEVEALERKAACLLATLRAVLSPALFVLVWELGDAKEKLGLAERLLAERARVGARARPVPESAPPLRSAAEHLLPDGGPPASPAEDTPVWVQERLARSASALRATHANLGRIRLIPHG